jgi:hypothetical protein
VCILLFSVRSCGLLDVPRSKKSSYEYTIGTTTTVTECRSGSLSGNTTYTCVDNLGETQAWSPDVTAKCGIKGFFIEHKLLTTFFLFVGIFGIDINLNIVYTCIVLI